MLVHLVHIFHTILAVGSAVSKVRGLLQKVFWPMERSSHHVVIWVRVSPHTATGQGVCYKPFVHPVAIPRHASYSARGFQTQRVEETAGKVRWIVPTWPTESPDIIVGKKWKHGIACRYHINIIITFGNVIVIALGSPLTDGFYLERYSSIIIRAIKTQFVKRGEM